MIELCRWKDVCWEAALDVLLFDRLEKSFKLGIVINGKGLIEGMGEVLGYGSGIHQPLA